MAFSIQKIESIEEFKGLKNIWDELLDGKKHYRPFLDYDWFELWLDHFLNNNRLFILLCEDQNRLKAICPFLIKKEKLKGIPVKKIELIGNIYSPVRNFIIGKLSDGEKEGFLLNLFDYLKTSAKWDLIDLNPLPDEDFDFMGFTRLLNKSGFKSKEYFCFGNWYLDDIDFNGNQYISSRTSNIRENIKRYSRKLQKMGKLQFVMVTNSSNEELDHYMDLYYTVYHASWKAPEMDPSFHRDLAKLVRGKGWLRLGFLFLDTSPMAAQLWLVCEGVAYIAKLAYDENYKKLIPGVILSSEMMKYVIDIDRVKEIDYLIGDEPYKKDWTPNRRERKGILIFNNNFKGDCLALMMIKAAAVIEKNRYLKQMKRKISRYLNRIGNQ
jgi:hypothetical protein